MLIQFPEGQLRSGKSGSLVFSKAGYVSPHKAHTLPKNASNTKVQSNFQLFSSFYKYFARGDASFIPSWASYKFEVTNRIGNKVIITGKAAFIRMNMNLVGSGQSPVEMPPTNLFVQGIPRMGIATSVTGSLLRIQITANSNLQSVNVFASGGFSAGKHSADKNMFRKIATIDCSVANLHNVLPQYLAVFHSFLKGNRMSLYVQNVNSNGIPGAICQHNFVINA